MRIGDFYPYATRPDSILLGVSSVNGAVRRASDGSLLLHELDFDPITVGTNVEVPESVYGVVLHESELDRLPVNTILTLNSVESRYRAAIGVARTNGEHQLVFHRADWRGAVELRACLVRNENNRALPQGYASRKGAILAWSETTRLLFDPPQLPPGDYLNVVWEDFHNGPQWLRRQQDHLFAVDASTDPPILLLNQGVPHAYEVLNSTATSGRSASIRDATYSMIVHQVWSSILAEALVTVAETQNGDADDASLVLEELPTWKKAVIVDWAPRLYPEEDADNALSRLTASVKAGNWSRDVLQRRLPEAIQRHHTTWRSFHHMVREVDS